MIGKEEIDSLKDMCTEQSFQRGLRYFQEGRVKIFKASPSCIAAIVAGSENYRVEIDLDKFHAFCTCPYDLEGFCKHIVAAFLAIDNDKRTVDSMMDESRQELKKMHSLLESVEPKALKEFVLREMQMNPDLVTRFMACFSERGDGRSLSEYKREIDSLFDEVEVRGFIHYGAELDFAPFENLADIYIRKDEFLEGAKIYQALTETIAKKMDHVDDSDGYYGGKFSEFLEGFVDCLRLAELEAEARQTYIDYLFNKYLQNYPDYFQDDYYDALMQLCTDKEDLTYWKKLLEPHLPDSLPDKEDWSKYYQAKKLVSMQLHLHSGLGEMAEFYALMERHYRFCPDFCLQYAKKMLEDGERTKAIQIAEEGISHFPDHLSKDLREFLSENYRERDPNRYKEQLMMLFFTRGEWKYYERLKTAATKDEWQAMLDRILVHFSEDRYARGKLIEIYLREQMNEAAVRLVLAQKSIDSLRAYHDKLAGLYPKEYFAAYRELIFPFVECRMGRGHYRDIAAILKDMKGIEGFGSETQEIVERLRRENKRKPAFIDELKSF
jgi:hypothetical protein